MKKVLTIILSIVMLSSFMSLIIQADDMNGDNVTQYKIIDRAEATVEKPEAGKKLPDKFTFKAYSNDEEATFEGVSMRWRRFNPQTNMYEYVEDDNYICKEGERYEVFFVYFPNGEFKVEIQDIVGTVNGQPEHDEYGKWLPAGEDEQVGLLCYRWAEPLAAPISTEPTEPISQILMGDVNGDGAVKANDARTALRAAAQLEALNEAALKAADLDGNGKVTAAEARKILRFAAKLDKELK